MTNEQAIEILKKDKALCEFNPTTGEDEPISEDSRKSAEALDMAIKALEQQPSDDCVSRKELLKLYGNRAFELQKTHQTDKQLGINWCINTLNELPPVTPTHGTCKDCKHNYKTGRNTFECSNGHRFALREPSTFYCKDFEKRGNENGA